MFDAFKVHHWAWSGKLKKHPDLPREYWMYLFFQILSFVACVYTAFMSHKFWYYSLGNVSHANTIAWIITSSFATVAFVCISYIGYYLNSYFRNYYISKQSKITFKKVLITAICVIGFDVYANLQGVDEHAHNSTDDVIENKTDGIDSKYQSRIEHVEAQRDKEVKQHENAIADLKNTKKHSCNVRGCEKGYHKGKRGNPHWNGAITPFGYAAIAKHEAEIKSIKAAAKSRIDNMENKQSIALKEHSSDREMSRAEYSRHVGLKIEGHSSFVKLLYLIILFISLYNSEFLREAKLFTNNSDVYKAKDLNRKMVEKRMALEQRRAEKQIENQYKDIEPEEAPQSQEAPQKAEKKGILETLIGDPKDNPIKNALDKYEGVQVKDDEGDKPVIRTGSTTNFKTNPEWEKVKHMRVIPQVSNEVIQSSESITGFPYTCQNCQKEGVAKTSRKKYCSDQCRREYHNKSSKKQVVI